jgi:N-acylneuraminate cytidylyltransferase
MTPSTLAVIPARGGSKGLPGKNVRRLAGLPLIEHSLRLAALCPEIDRTIVSTDSEDIRRVALAAGGDVPFLRAAGLARDDTPMLPVLRHALDELDPGAAYDFVLLLDPTSPGRLPGDVSDAHRLLEERDDADGVVAVSEPPSNPIWHSVILNAEGFVEQLIPHGGDYTRRQDVPRVLRINAALYLWRADFVRTAGDSWSAGCHLPLEIPELRAFHIDSEQDLQLAELVLGSRLVALPWL